MASAFTLSQSDLLDSDLDSTQLGHGLHQSLSIPALSRVDTESLSPSIIQFDTPGGESNISHYQPSDCSDLDVHEDPFFGANFNDVATVTPHFLETDSHWDIQPSVTDISTAPSLDVHQNVAAAASSTTTYPMTPAHSSSIHTESPAYPLSITQRKLSQRQPPIVPTSVSPNDLHSPFKPPPVLVHEATQLTPSGTNSERSSEDGLAPAIQIMPAQSPRVTVSVWNGDENKPVHTMERTFDSGHEEEQQQQQRDGFAQAGDLHSVRQSAAEEDLRRDSLERWERSTRPRHADTGNRTTTAEVPSINETASQRDTDERNSEVGKWLSGNHHNASAPAEKSAEEICAIDSPGQTHDATIGLGNETENRYQPGRSYFDHNGGDMNETDLHIFRSIGGIWGDAPVESRIHDGTPGQYQPQTSQAAIERFNRLCRDTDSILSRAATWGTRRRSMPSILDFDIEEVTSGNLFKKLSISRNGNDKSSSRPANIFNQIRGRLTRLPSASTLRKRSRSRSAQGEALRQPKEENSPQPEVRRDSSPHLSPMSRTSSWGKKPTSLGAAVAAMASPLASVGGTNHVRSGSISFNSPLTSPKIAGLTLAVKNPLGGRRRSKSDLPKPTSALAIEETHSNLVGMWKKTGGPPVAAAALHRSNGAAVAAADGEEDDDDDDDLEDDPSMKADPNIIDDITANFNGFQQHILRLNPGLEGAGNYLIDRIAHQQVVRYKLLLTTNVKHLGLGANCPSGALCLALGGTAIPLDQKGDTKGIDPMSVAFEADDEGVPPEGLINKESFPKDIPLPPTRSLPAEFECKLCFQRKKFQKPSDWTKHVHEDVQPFTCTWPSCRDPKTFKRKADWVRHENEGHRHLEWWTCDVEDCRHTCYRRDNFLQHLVREHKFLEPKVKTRAALKRAVAPDPTWQKVEQCHIETPARPQAEPCRFCGKSFPTWKKLTVHLAKHMEQISLPVLRLVTAKAKELAADTIISPVQDPPPRPSIPLPGDATIQSSNMFHHNAMYAHQDQQLLFAQQSHQLGGYQQQQAQSIYPMMQDNGMNMQYYNMGHQAHMNSLDESMNQGFTTSRAMANLDTTTAASFLAAPTAFVPLHHANNSVEAFPQLGGMSMTGGQMGFDNDMMHSSVGNSVHGSPFSAQETLSTYSHSPHLNPTGQQGTTGWDEQRPLSGFQ